MSEAQHLRIAIVGCGQIADAHIQEVQKIPIAKLVGVCDRERDLARQAAERFGVPNIFDDLGRMLEELRPNVIHITTPPHTHAPLACQALQGGAHVYVEKPFTIDGPEAIKVIQTAQANQRTVCVGHDHLFDPCWLDCRKAIANGEVGEIVHVESILGYDLSGPFGRVMFSDKTHWVHRLPGNFIQNNLSHALYKITDLIPNERPQVWATWFGDTPSQGPPTELRVHLKWPQSTASIFFSSAARPLQRVVRIYGTKKTLEVDFDGRLLRWRKKIGAPGPFAKIAMAMSDLKQASRSLMKNFWRFLRADLQYFAGMNRLFETYYRSIINKKDPPILDTEILRVTEIMDEIFAKCHSETTNQRTSGTKLVGMNGHRIESTKEVAR